MWGGMDARGGEGEGGYYMYIPTTLGHHVTVMHALRDPYKGCTSIKYTAITANCSMYIVAS